MTQALVISTAITPLTSAEVAPAPLDPARWIALEDAAGLLHKNVGHMRRLAKDDWSPKDLARFGALPGGKEKWYISRAIDARLADQVGLDQLPPAFAALPKDLQDGALARAACVQRFREQRATIIHPLEEWLPAFLAELSAAYPAIDLTRSSLYRWSSVYRRPADILHLVDRRGGNTRGAAHGAAWDFFRNLYLTDHEPTAKECWRQTRDEAKLKGWLWCSYKSCLRDLDRRIPPQMATLHRRPRRYLKQFQPTIHQDPDQFAPGIRWEGDHRQSNVWVRVERHGVTRPERPWLTGWIDTRSGKITGWCLSLKPSSTSILAALRHGLLDETNCGGPDIVKIDNGKDYDCFTFQGRTKPQRLKLGLKQSEAGLLGMLQIQADFSLPRNPTGKPHIERWFETLENFDKKFTGYCARKPEDCPQSTKELLKAKQYHRLPTFAHYKDALAEHIHGWNASTGADRDSEHTITRLEGMSPNEYFAKYCPRVRVLPAREVLDLLLQKWHKPVRPGKDGIPLTAFGMTIHYGGMDMALTPYKPGYGKPGVELRVAHDPHDYSFICAYTLDWKPVGRFRLNGMGQGEAAEEQVKELVAEKRRYFKALRAGLHNKHYETETPEQLLARKITADRRAEKDVRERPLRLIQTPLDAAAKQTHILRRKVAGAEQATTEERIDLAAIQLGGSPVSGGERLTLNLTEGAFPSAKNTMDDTDVAPLTLHFSDPEPPGEEEKILELLDERRTASTRN